MDRTVTSPLDDRILALVEDHPDVGFTAQDIADLVGTTVHTVHETMSRLRRAGLLNVQSIRVYRTPLFRTGAAVVAEREART